MATATTLETNPRKNAHLIWNKGFARSLLLNLVSLWLFFGLLSLTTEGILWIKFAYDWLNNKMMEGHFDSSREVYAYTTTILMHQYIRCKRHGLVERCRPPCFIMLRAAIANQCIFSWLRRIEYCDWSVETNFHGNHLVWSSRSLVHRGTYSLCKSKLVQMAHMYDF